MGAVTDTVPLCIEEDAMPMTCLHCDQCQTPLLRYPSLVRPHNFCGRACQGAWRSANLTGTRAANWQRGSRRSNGYIEVYAPWAACATAKGYAPLHRLIVEVMLGRPLAEGTIVHHRDGDVTNNHPDNLSVMSQSDHINVHRDVVRRKRVNHA